MISPAVLAETVNYRRVFQSARPFKHVCIDGFFTEEAAEGSLRDFPAFDREFARNELGEYGGKAVRSNIGGISPFYATLYDYLMSERFLTAMSDITGIDGLLGDPALYGGGTHENLNGQGLDVHVDFNFHVDGSYHRRLNLLVYLNKEWDPGWGGAIELHSNPRRPEEDRVVEFNVLFNRALIFETNERSWHGFREIRLPPGREHLSRKCLSIYLYTRDRPAEEIVGPHGTFYIQWPFPERMLPGRTLTAADIDELRAGYTNRDRQIEMYQKLEVRRGDEATQLRRYLTELLGATRAPLLGYARQIGGAAGLFPDGWAARELAVTLCPEREVSKLAIRGFIPDEFPQVEREFALRIDERRLTCSRDGNGAFELLCPVDIAAGSRFEVALSCSADYNPSAAGRGADQRSLAYRLDAIELTHADR